MQQIWEQSIKASPRNDFETVPALWTVSYDDNVTFKSRNGSLCSEFHTFQRNHLKSLAAWKDGHQSYCDHQRNDLSALHCWLEHFHPPQSSVNFIWWMLRVDFRPLLCWFLLFWSVFVSVLILLYFNACCHHRAEIILLCHIDPCAWMFFLLKYCMWHHL